MIDQNKRKSIFLLHEEGMSIREICRRLGLSRKTVRDIVKQKGAPVDSIRKDKIMIDKELLGRLYWTAMGLSNVYTKNSPRKRV